MLRQEAGHQSQVRRILWSYFDATAQVRAAARQEFMAAYPDAEVTTIKHEDFTDFLTTGNDADTNRIQVDIV